MDYFYLFYIPKPIELNDLKLVFDPERDVAVATNFTLQTLKTLVLSASIHRIGFACHSLDGGVGQEVQVLRRTQGKPIN